MKTKLSVCICLAIASLQMQNMNAQSAQKPKNTLKDTTIDRYYNYVKQFLEGAAETMPAEKYNFKLTPAQMSFGEWMNHSTERNYLDCSILRGEMNPMPKAKTDLIQGKAEISKNLKDSFEYCDSTFAKLDDAKILSSPQLTASFLHTVVHNNEIYGNVVGYMRSAGIVPPSTVLMNKLMSPKK